MQLYSRKLCRTDPKPERAFATAFGVVRAWRCEMVDGATGLLITRPNPQAADRPEDVIGFFGDEYDRATVSQGDAEALALAYTQGILTGQRDGRAALPPDLLPEREAS